MNKFFRKVAERDLYRAGGALVAGALGTAAGRAVGLGWLPSLGIGMASAVAGNHAGDKLHSYGEAKISAAVDKTKEEYQRQTSDTIREMAHAAGFKDLLKKKSNPALLDLREHLVNNAIQVPEFNSKHVLTKEDESDLSDWLSDAPKLYNSVVKYKERSDRIPGGRYIRIQ